MERAVVVGVLTVVVGLACATPRPGAAPGPRLEGADAAALDRFVAEQVEREALVGLSVAVARDGEVLLAKGYGVRSAAGREPVGADTPFAVGSVTKQFTAACVFLLAEDGRLSLADPVEKYFPGLTRAQDITLLDLVNHVSGYPDYYPLDFVDRRLARPIAPDELIRRYAGGPLDFEPGTRFSYSNTGYVILGRVVEKVSGEPFGDFLARRILGPLGLAHTRYEPEPGEAGLAVGHLRFALGPFEAAAPEAKGWLGGAGGLWSTAGDLVRWDLALAAGQVLRPSSWAAMTTMRRLAGGATSGYGGGLVIGARAGAPVLTHDGAVSGFTAFNQLHPASRSAVAVLANSEDQGARRIATRLLAAIAPRASAPAVKGPPAAEAARALLRGLQSGAVDRAGLGEEFSAFLTEARLRAAAERLAPYGEPAEVKVLATAERGGMESSTLELVFERGTLEASLYRRPDGTVEQFLVRSP